MNMIPVDEDKVIKAVEKASKFVVSVSTITLVSDYMFYSMPVSGIGSGIVYDSRGFIVTNNHVIAEARQINVTFSDSKVYEGRIVGGDPLTDVAVLKVPRTELKAAEFYDSNKLKVGQFVLALGNPFGLVGGPTVTAGVISALKRRIQAKGGPIIEELIQTDAAINPGNSGGPLINLEGQVVGMSTAIIPYAQGIGFAVTSNTVRRVADEIIRFGHVVRPWLGINGVDMNPGIAEYYNLAIDFGVLVVSVIENSPAYYADIREGDIIVQVDEERIINMNDLLTILWKKKVGEEAFIKVVRGEHEVSFKIKLAKSPFH
ncbi:MAG: trypsin-like peptidase domain-containing protein [Nitrososphaeria archaeon]|nr:trypsin-like peptidase domain-containing protein [Nitrososphaeria archaeon]